MAREELTPSKIIYLLVRPNGNEPCRKARSTRVFKFLRVDCATQMEKDLVGKLDCLGFQVPSIS